MKKLLFHLGVVLLFLMLPSLCAARGICWYEPIEATQQEEITVYYDATLGNGALKDFTGDVYAHAGVLTDQSISDGDWKHSPEWCDNSDKYKMQRSSDDPNVYTITLTPTAYYGLSDDETVRSLAFVFRNADGSLQGKNEGERDIIVPFVAQPTVAGSIGEYVSYSDDGTTVAISATEGTLCITPYNDYVIKVFTQPEGDDTPERRSITVCANPDADYTIEETDEELTIKTNATEVVVDKATCSVRFLDKDGNVRLAENGGLNNGSTPRTCSFRGMGDAAFYGGGYNGERINQDGARLTMNNTQTGGWENTWSAPHNICIPFYVSTSGYGILFDDHYRYAQIVPSYVGTTYTSGSLNPIAYYYVGGDGSMASVLENYTFLTGRQELPPYWALGYMTSRYGYHSRTEAEEVVRRIKEESNLPLDAIVFDLYWQGEGNSGMGNLDWYKPNWNNPSEMMSNFKQQGVQTICITEPFFTSATSNYQSLKDAGYFADSDVSGMGWLGASSVGLIDSSNPDAMDWMWNFYKARTDEGVSGWWLDLGEPEQHDGDSQHLGGTVDQIHNEFNDLWVERVYRGLKATYPDVRPFLMPRSGTAGMQRYSTFPWTGDIRRSWGGLKAQIPALVSSGMSGVAYMGSDVGGFSASGTDPDLYLRWIEFSVFSPMMRTHSSVEPEPYNSCYSGILPSIQRYITLRYSYLPYLYTLAYENATHGTPLARPVNFYDATSWQTNCLDAYLWGKDLFVAPVVEDATSRSITFPAGTWIDMNDQKTEYSGLTTVSYDAPLETLPYFARKGSFIPRFSQTSFTNTLDIDHSRLTIAYFMDDSNPMVTGKIFDDDKTSTTLSDNVWMINLSGYRDGNTDIISYTTEGNGYEGMPAQKILTFEIPNYLRAAKNVAIHSSDGDRDLSVCASKSAFEACETGYYLDSDNVLHVRVAVDLTAVDIRIENAAGGVSAAELPEKQASLSYSATSNMLTYSLPVDCATVVMRIMNTSGVQMAVLENVATHSGVSQVVCPALSSGFYVVQMTASTPDGQTISKSGKIVVR